MRNITEIGEEKITHDLKNSFDSLKRKHTNKTLKNHMRQSIFQILKLNMIAIRKKSDIVKHTV